MFKIKHNDYLAYKRSRKKVILQTKGLIVGGGMHQFARFFYRNIIYKETGNYNSCFYLIYLIYLTILVYGHW